MIPTREGPWLGYRKYEASAMTYATTTGTKIAVAGDFRAGFVIVDRIGLQIEVIPHLFGANRRPTGQRGVYAFWRSGSKAVNPNALRYLEVK